MAEELSDAIYKAVESSLIDFLRKGEWISNNYSNRIEIPKIAIRAVYDSVDMSRVHEIVGERVEQRIADQIFNSLATEISTDVKRIMCNTELREDCRAVIREKMRKFSEGNK